MTKATAVKFQVFEGRPTISGVRVGKIVALGDNGHVVVDYSGNPYGPAAARVVESLEKEHVRLAAARNSDVLMVFEDNDPRFPILVDVVGSRATRETSVRSTTHNKSAKNRLTHADSNATEGDVSQVGLGRIVSIREGIVYVDFDGNQEGPKAARTTIPLRNLEEEVVLLFLPSCEVIVIGQVFRSVPMEPPGTPDTEIFLKGRKIHIEGEQEVVLSCGRTSIHLDSRGKARTTADQVVTRARGANKIQGGCVQIN
jgi:Domain of unknown function (DUF6484)